ncbi:phosphoenolpyruvate carboxykinase (GTP) [Oceanispirochaeta sp.]|jgi:phosphoenolpyruvate carboxykinase (GTP)|uniref:phosphoenolpyruvate carboxykinase (GTP) n=1 Tax=Oceanispirochaeta sp. TaxID=2035350 RepID=UPI00261F20C3|nr:phosphoenolpyruvate carboxykinase (GTP) [Oceanispirochaeta sp.]MDA3957206.1 phosphoenolpyruvate carboxykinase (GTP) [Oceanispirochaeta sp.]
MSVPTKNKKLIAWVNEIAAMTTPDQVIWCDGSTEEYDRLMAEMVGTGMAIKLNEKLRPNSYAFNSDPSDVARVEGRTYIASVKEENAGPTNNWIDPVELKKIMVGKYTGCMKGRPMYVIPFSMGPGGSPIAKVGIEITDSPYVVVNMHTMTRVSNKVLEVLGDDGDFIPCLHSVGSPLEPGQKDSRWPCAPIEEKYIAHFPEENLIWSYGSGYGGNALLGKKCLALRIASAMAGREGWMAEHMLILRFTNPEGKKYHIAAAFPSACGKTNLAMLQSTVPGWKVETIGDDIAWMKPGADGRLYAINPEAGFFGVAPGTSEASNPMALASCSRDAIFTNVVVTPDKDVWWEDMGVECAGGTDWKNNPWNPGMKDADGKKILGAHPNSRFTAKAELCPVICADWEDPAGVPIDIFVFGGKRSSVMPLVHEAFDFEQGVYMGATASSEPTAAALDLGNVSLRFDPFAMTPFIGYHAGDYMQHWFDMGKMLGDKAPKVFYVNWFQKDGKRFVWPGFGENSRVLKWMCDRVEGKVDAIETPIGMMPANDDLAKGLNLAKEDWDRLMKVDTVAFKKTVEDAKVYLAKFGDKLPKKMTEQLEKLEKRLG